MAVTQSVVLPAQPAAGSSRLIGLSGNGFDYPRSMYEVQNQVAGDATAGLVTLNITTDPRYVSIIYHVELVVLGAAAAQDYFLQMSMRDSGVSVTHVGQTIQNSVQTLTPGNAWWDPPALLPAETLTSVVANVNGDTTLLKTWVYNFDINALTNVPLPLLLASLPRNASQSPNS